MNATWYMTIWCALSVDEKLKYVRRLVLRTRGKEERRKEGFTVTVVSTHSHPLNPETVLNHYAAS